jgi:hypothetical protein
MSLLPACAAVLPGFLCGHADVMLYLLPAAAFAVLFRILARVHPAFFLLSFVGTLCHELAHFGVGLLTNAEPTRISLLPRRKGKTWELGSVTFSNLRWYNAAPVALAPLLILLLPLTVAAWRTGPGWHFGPLDLALAPLLAAQFLSFWPSGVDWRLATRSWPWALLVLAGAAVFVWQDTLFQFIKS